ncbi:MAG: GntR family transcriptional regulator [Rhodobacteraceae bacterium]|nr:GntR family transcriptional regulator [Paracoccaceae bacterium]
MSTRIDTQPRSIGSPADGKASVDAIQAEMTRRICFLDYPPGCELKEAELAREFGVSRTPIRDAISRIKHLGLIETRNGVGTVVIALTPAQIRQVYEMRLHLATLIGPLSLTSVSERSAAPMSKLLDTAITLQKDFDPRAYVDINDQLQNLIADMIGNDLLRSFWLQTYYQAASTWYRVATHLKAEAAESLVQELKEMTEALAQSDMTAVGYVQRIHIGYGYARIEKFLTSDFFVPKQSGK